MRDNFPAHRARRRMGQNFLRDPVIIAQIVQLMRLRPTDSVIEIGPGLGALTQPLLQQLDRLIAIELDRDLVPRLQKLSAPGTLVIHNADALAVPFDTLTNALPLRIVGNLPYNISTPLLFHLLGYRDRIRDMHFMLQKEVVDRLTAEPGSRQFGRLSGMLQYYCETQRLLEVPPSAFRPAPKVKSAVVRLTPRAVSSYPDVPFAQLETLVRLAFATRRKTLRNNLKNWVSADTISRAGLDPQARPETLSVTDFAILAGLLPVPPVSVHD